MNNQFNTKIKYESAICASSNNSSSDCLSEDKKNKSSTTYELSESDEKAIKYVALFRSQKDNLKKLVFYYTYLFSKYNNLEKTLVVYSKIFNNYTKEKKCLLGLCYCLHYYNSDEIKEYFLSLLGNLLCSQYEEVQIEALSIIEDEEDKELISKLLSLQLGGLRYATYLEDYLR